MVITPETRRTISSFRHIATSSLRRPLSRALAWDGHTWSVWAEKAATGQTWGSRGRENATPHQSSARFGTMKGCDFERFKSALHQHSLSL